MNSNVLKFLLKIDLQKMFMIFQSIATGLHKQKEIKKVDEFLYLGGYTNAPFYIDSLKNRQEWSFTLSLKNMVIMSREFHFHREYEFVRIMMS